MKSNRCNTESLYKTQKDRLLNLIQSRVENKEQAEDIVHDTFEKFENCCQAGCECEYPKSYLFKMALNTVADFFRRKKKVKKVELKTECNAIEEIDQKELPCDVYECVYLYLEKLSPENQQAYIMSDIQNIPQNEIAAELGIPVSTLKSRVQRTRTYLKQEFEKCFCEC